MGDELQVDLIVQAIDRASAVMNQVASNTAGLTTKTQEHTQAVQKGESVFTTFNQAMGAANQVMQISKQVWDSSVGSVISYDESIREVSAATGISSEETSKLIDLTDNFGISTNDLMLAQKKLASEGYSLNIDTLKSLATQYSEMGSQAEKTTFLTDNFGRSGLHFAEMFDFGTAAMDRFYNGSADGMVRTKEQTHETLMLTIAQKDLGDAWQGFTNKVVTPMVPGITSYIKTTTDELAAFTSGNAADAIGFIGHQYQLAFGLIKDESAGAAAAMDKTTEAKQRMFGPAKPTAEQLDAMNVGKYNEIIGLSQQVGAQSISLSAAQDALQEKIAAVRAEMERSIRVGYLPTGQHMTELKQNLSELTGQYRANESAALQNTNSQVYADYLKMNSSKQMTTALFQQQQELGVALGIFSAADAKTATNIYELEQKLQAGSITAKEFAASLKHVADVPAPPTGQQAAQAWQATNQQEATAPTQGPQMPGATGQGSAQAWMAVQEQAKKTQDAAKAATASMTTEFAAYSSNVQKQADAANGKVKDLVDTLTSLGKMGTITITVVGSASGASGGSEYPP